MKINLTKKSKKQLYDQPNGTGIIFIKIGDKKIRIIEFYLSWSKNFYVLNNTVAAPMELIETLHNLVPEIEDEK